MASNNAKIEKVRLNFLIRLITFYYQIKVNRWKNS